MDWKQMAREPSENFYGGGQVNPQCEAVILLERRSLAPLK